jgi:hypothetical protein
LEQYGAILEKNPYSVGRLRDLPFEKQQIRNALIEALINTDDAGLRTHLKSSLMWLEAFVSDEEFDLVSKHEADMLARSKGLKDAPTDAQLSTWEPYVEILGRVRAKQRETMSCILRSFPPED